MLIQRLSFRRRAGHQLQLLLLGRIRTVLGQLLQHVRPGVHRYVQVVGEGGAVRAGTGERVLLAGLLVGVDQGEYGVQVGAGVLAQLLHQLGVVDGVDGHVVAGLVAHLRALDVELDVHAGAAAALVQLAVHRHLGQEGVLGVERTENAILITPNCKNVGLQLSQLVGRLGE